MLVSADYYKAPSVGAKVTVAPQYFRSNSDGIELDGGGSTALAVDGQIIRAPGRQLTATLQIFVEE